jgi:hypothetical protein
MLDRDVPADSASPVAQAPPARASELRHTAYLGDLDQVLDQVTVQPKCPVKPTGTAQTRQLPKTRSQCARAYTS